jgi:hypothetical protein
MRNANHPKMWFKLISLHTAQKLLKFLEKAAQLDSECSLQQCSAQKLPSYFARCDFNKALNIYEQQVGWKKTSFSRREIVQPSNEREGETSAHQGWERPGNQKFSP